LLALGTNLEYFVVAESQITYETPGLLCLVNEKMLEHITVTTNHATLVLSGNGHLAVFSSERDIFKDGEDVS
jgi:hypothetical protein